MGRSSPYSDASGLKRGPWTPEEDQKLLANIQQHGHGSWRSLPEKAAAHLPKRTDNEIKNYWNTHIKKRLAMMGIDPVTHRPKVASLGAADGDPKNASNLSHMAQWETARLEAETRLVKESRARHNEPTTDSLSPRSRPSPSVHLLNKMATRPRCLDIPQSLAKRLFQGTQAPPTVNASFGEEMNAGLNKSGVDMVLEAAGEVWTGANDFLDRFSSVFDDHGINTSMHIGSGTSNHHEDNNNYYCNDIMSSISSPVYSPTF
ncbi:hypothetical protein Patl1_18785 [Pistacia atlantica]|uniref:Uncharacterized protein n=1 Tax=Pistacia atlantica TaxID=434234 RepID=A0ACC1BZA6_9ROSI|nr:hypothetical protein Patl1_18785 [Pistacia atlantica]